MGMFGLYHVNVKLPPVVVTDEPMNSLLSSLKNSTVTPDPFPV